MRGAPSSDHRSVSMPNPGTELRGAVPAPALQTGVPSGAAWHRGPRASVLADVGCPSLFCRCGRGRHLARGRCRNRSNSDRERCRKHAECHQAGPHATFRVSRAGLQLPFPCTKKSTHSVCMLSFGEVHAHFRMRLSFAGESGQELGPAIAELGGLAQHSAGIGFRGICWEPAAVEAE